VEMAKHLLGPDWMRQYVEKATAAASSGSSVTHFTKCVNAGNADGKQACCPRLNAGAYRLRAVFARGRVECAVAFLSNF